MDKIRNRPHLERNHFIAHLVATLLNGLSRKRNKINNRKALAQDQSFVVLAQTAC